MSIHVINSHFLTRSTVFGMSKNKLLNIRIDPELKKKAKKLAEADGRSLSNWVTKLIAGRVERAEKDQSGKSG
jgi:predicted transcriptional regulator